MPTMHHPTIEGVAVEVPAGNAADWREQGWRESVGVKGPELPHPRAVTRIPRKKD
jgi:hypothetical protein